MKPAGKNTILYLHVLDWPKDGKLTVPGLKNPVKSAELLAGGAKLKVGASESGPVLTLPAAAIWHFTGRGLLGWVVTVPLLLIPWVILTVLYNKRLAPATRTYHFADS